MSSYVWIFVAPSRPAPAFLLPPEKEEEELHLLSLFSAYFKWC